MLKKTMTYTDFNGVTKTEDKYFNLTKAEMLEMEMSTTGGMDVFVKRIIETEDKAQLIKLFKEIILKAYGEKTADGRFEKSEALSAKFASTQAYSDLFMELATDDKAAADFINGIIPQEVKAQMKQAN